MTADGPEPWEAFFDEHYLLTYPPLQPAERSRGEAVGAARLAGLAPGARLLDAPCGYGRHAMALAEAGYHTIGLDRSPTQVAEAQPRRGGAEWPRLVRADYRQVPFASGSFDGALNLLSSLGYLGDEGDREVLGEFRRVLRPGGRLVIDTNHRDRLPRQATAREWTALPDGAFLLSESRVDRVEGLVELTHTYLARGGMPQARTIRWRAYSATELVSMLRAVGFVGVECYGNLDGHAFAADTRLVLVARAPAMQEGRG